MSRTSSYIWTDIENGRKGPVHLAKAPVNAIDLPQWLISRAIKEPTRAFGCSAKFLLTAGGDRSLLWLDCDTKDEMLILRLTDRLPRGSFIVTKSSSGRHHVYVVTPRTLRNLECDNLKAHMALSIDDSRALGCIDRIYGPKTGYPIYLPRVDGVPMLPQQLCKDLPNSWDPFNEVIIKNTP